MGRACSAYGGKERLYKVLVGELEGKRQLGRPKSKWEDYIKVDLQEVGCGVWTTTIWLRMRTVVNAVMNLQVP